MVVSAPGSPYQQCLRFAASQGEVLMGEMVQAARTQLFRQVGGEADSPKRSSLQAALRALNQHERFLRHHFPQSLLVEFSVAANNQTKSAVPAPKVESDRGWISFDQLELMDDMQLQERVEVARIQEMALQSSEVELSELNRLICGAQGLENVQADRNPMRPETYSRTLRATLLATNESLAVRLAWMQHMGEILGRSLAVTYAQLSKMLRDLGVQPAGYQVSMAPQMGRTGMFMVDGVQMVPVGPGGVPATLVPLSAMTQPLIQAPPLVQGIPVPDATVPPAAPYRPLATTRPRADLSLPPLPDLISELPPLPSELPSLPDLPSILPSLPPPTEPPPPPSPLPFPAPAPSPTASPTPTPAPAPAPESSADKLLTLSRLRRLLSGELDAPPAARVGSVTSWTGHREVLASSLKPDFSETVPAAFEALEEMKQLGQVVERLEHRQQRDAASSPANVSLLREQFRREARGMGQLLGLEVVQLMVDNIAHDPRLLPPVREAVLTLEPALLRLVLKDPRFFSDRQHPARCLLEDITQRSLGYDSIKAEGFAAFMQPVQTTVEALALIGVEGPEPFEHALNSLHEDWGRLSAQQPRQEKAVQALLQAEQRSMLATQITKELRERVDVQLAPPDIVQLVLGPWAQVMAQARLNHPNGGADPEGYGALVKDLVWSSRPPLARGDRNRLVRLIPDLIRQLRLGLDSINYPAERRDNFLDVLMDLHQQAFKPGEVQPSIDPNDSSPIPLRAALDARFDDANEPGPWFVGTEAKDTGFMDSGSIREAQSPTAGQFQPTQMLSGRTVQGGEPAPDPVEALLKPGTWLEIQTNGQWVRTQLTWISPQGALFMFTTVNGAAQSMTRRSFERLFERAAVRPLAEQTVVDVALDAVTQAALRNSLTVRR